MNRSSKQIVDTYGLHEDSDGIKWLLQQGVGLNAVGIPPKECPFRIKTHLLLCSHKFDLQQKLEPTDRDLVEYEKLLLRSQLLQFFDPFYPHEKKVLYVETDETSDFQSIAMAQELANPTVSASLAMDFAKDGFDGVARRLRSSNLSTFLLFGMKNDHLGQINKLVGTAMSAKGRMVIAGGKVPMHKFGSLAQIIFPEEKVFKFLNRVDSKKLRMIGSHRLKLFMRG